MERRPLVLVVVVLLTFALAQASPGSFENASMGYGVDVPAGWSAEPTADHLFLRLWPPTGSPHAGRVSITVAVEPAYGGTLEQGIEEFVTGLRSAVPDLRVVARWPATVSGRPAAMLELRGTTGGHDRSYRLAFLLVDGRGYVVFLDVLTEHLSAAAGQFDAVVASFVLTQATALLAGPALADVYAGGSLTLALEPAAGGYVGTLRHGDAVYPVAARTTADGLAGTFESGGHAFEFIATLRDGLLILATGGATYTLAPKDAPPLEPAVPPVADAHAAAVEVPHPCMLLALLPGAATAGPPPGIGPGTRLVYYAAAASIAGAREYLVEDPAGPIVDRATGKRYSWSKPENRPDYYLIRGDAAAGEGFRVLQVGHVDATVAQLGMRSYLIDGGRTMFTSEEGAVTHAGCAGDYWVHPAVLAGLAEVHEGGVRVLRMAHRLGEQTFDAIRIQTTTGSGSLTHVYDLASGLLLYSGGIALTTELISEGPDVFAHVEGSTQLTEVRLVEVASVDVPWRDAPAPPWLAPQRTLEYQGTLSVHTGGGPVFPLPVYERLTVGALGSDWFVVQVEQAMTGVSGMSHQGTSTMAFGRASIGGPWIAPEALARLREGQVIERCDVVGYVTSVSAVGPSSVTISEVGPMHRRDRVYDRQTGMLTASDLVQQIGLAQHVLSVRLVRGP